MTNRTGTLSDKTPPDIYLTINAGYLRNNYIMKVIFKENIITEKSKVDSTRPVV